MAQIIFVAEGAEEIRARLEQLTLTELRVKVNMCLHSIGRLFVPAKGTGPLADATPRRTGKLARSTVAQVVNGLEEPRIEIRQGAQTPEGLFYGIFVREGTGIYGPTGQRIYPKTKKALSWGKDLGGGKKEFVFKSIAGQKPNPYHITIIRALMPTIQEEVNIMGQNIIAFISGNKI
jgi:hypothetical protein